MPSARDEEFIRFAAASGHLTGEQAEEALGALRDIEALGGSAAAPDLLLKRGLLSERQVALVHQAVAASKTATKVPRELAGFELIEKVGQGGMGSVFKARQKELNRAVALKVLSPRLARSSEFVERFLREARAAGRLNHPNIVAAIDVGEDQGFYYFAMEYVEGETLAKLLAREGPLAEERALRIAADVARALDHAQGKGLIHRDIKPDNIMVTPDGRVRVTDFGLAKAIGKGTPDGTDDERFLGTPAYVAPEQIRSEPDIDCRADIFSLGVTLFQMLTGELPFKGANPMAIAAAVVAEPLPPLRRLRPDVSAATARIVEKMTAKAPSERYATPAEVVAAIESALAAPRAPAPRAIQPRAPAYPPAGRVPRRQASHTTTYVAVAAVVLVLGALIALVVSLGPKGSWSKPKTPTTSIVVVPRPASRTLPDTSSRVAAAEAMMRELVRAIDSANSFEQQHPHDIAGQAAKLKALLDAYPPARREGLPPDGIDLLERAEARLAALQEQVQKVVERELGERLTRGEALLNAWKVNEAFALLDTFPTTLRTPFATERLAALRAQWTKRAIQLYEFNDADAKALVEQRKLDEAKAIYAGFARCVVPEVAERAKAALDALEQSAPRKVVESRRLGRAAYVREAKAILEQLGARQVREARNLADAAAVNPALAAFREEIGDLQHFVRTVGDVLAAAAVGAKKLRPGDKFRLGGLAGDVIESDGEKLVMRFGNVNVAKRLADLRPADIVDLAIRGYGGPSSALDAKLGLFLLAQRDYEGARKRLDFARANNADVTRELALLARFSPQVCPDCKGAKSVACPDCEGKGVASVERRDCEVCKGKGGGRCGFCHGTGRATCPSCGGSGRSPIGLNCNDCGGRRWVRCRKCGGDGYLTCSACKGTGTVTITTPCARCKGNRTVACARCGGTGSLPPPDLAPPPEAPAKP